MRSAWLFLAGLAAGGCAGRLDPAPLQPAVQGDSLLRPGDALRITVWRQPEFSGDFVVNPDSTVAHPLLAIPAGERRRVDGFSFWMLMIGWRPRNCERRRRPP